MQTIKKDWRLIPGILVTLAGLTGPWWTAKLGLCHIPDLVPGFRVTTGAEVTIFLILAGLIILGKGVQQTRKRAK